MIRPLVSARSMHNGLLVNRHDAEKLDHTLRDILARQLLIAIKPSNTRTALNWESAPLPPEIGEGTSGTG
jgi:hypothetical protein